MTESEPALTAAYRQTGLTVRELWLRFLALGGNADEVSVAAQLFGLLALPPGEFNVLAHTVNEALEDLPEAARAAPVPFLRLRADDDLRRRGG